MPNHVVFNALALLHSLARRSQYFVKIGYFILPFKPRELSECYLISQISTTRRQRAYQRGSAPPCVNQRPYIMLPFAIKDLMFTAVSINVPNMSSNAIHFLDKSKQFSIFLITMLLLQPRIIVAQCRQCFQPHSMNLQYGMSATISTSYMSSFILKHCTTKCMLQMVTALLGCTVSKITWIHLNQ